MKHVQARHYTPSNRTAIDLIVIHDMEYPERPSGAEWCADYFAGIGAPLASPHLSVDSDSAVRSVLDKDEAWHTPGMLGGRYINTFSIGIEHAGYARQTADEWRDDFSTAMLEISAQLVADLCNKYSIPPVHLTANDLAAGRVKGITGHDACTVASKTGSHWDPGPHFPWDWYMARVRDHLARLQVQPEHVTAGGDWPVVLLDGQAYEVSPGYLAPVAIGYARDLAARLGCELPSPALVDAIWQAADVRLDSEALRQTFPTWTMAEMSAPAAINEHFTRVEAQLAGRPYALLAGAQKDVVVRNGELGLYGWHTPAGKVLQPFYGGHVLGWIDYSQGCRLVRRVEVPKRLAIPPPP